MNKAVNILRALLISVAVILPCLSKAQPGISYPQVSIMTVDPGAVFYELEGHTGLRLKTAEYDIVANWGVFDFDAPNFVYRFVSGETDYICVAEPTGNFVSRYERYNPGRGISEQIIPLDSASAVALAMNVSNHLRPENRTYRYNYVKDNCALRPLELLEKAAGRELTVDSIPEPFGNGASYRDVMGYYHRNYPWYQFGIDLALGSGIDYPLEAREFAFAPVLMQKMLPYPAETVVPSIEGGVTEGPTPLWLGPGFIMWAAAILIILSVVLFKNLGAAIKIIYTTWFSLLALGGCIIFFLVFISTHEATSPNYNLLWLNPLCIIGAISPWIKKPKIVGICYHFTNFAAVLAYAIIWSCGIQHGNPAFIPLLFADAFLSVYYLMSPSKAK